MALNTKNSLIQRMIDYKCIYSNIVHKNSIKSFYQLSKTVINNETRAVYSLLWKRRKIEIIASYLVGPYCQFLYIGEGMNQTLSSQRYYLQGRIQGARTPIKLEKIWFSLEIPLKCRSYLRLATFFLVRPLAWNPRSAPGLWHMASK